MRYSMPVLFAVVAVMIGSPAHAQPCESKLLASDSATGDRFGYSVSINGDTAVVGAYLDNDSGFQAGSAYVFEKVNGIWTEVVKLLASDGADVDWFGHSVSIDGDTAVVGAPSDNDANHGLNSGSAYVFKKVEGVWTEVAKLVAADGAEGDEFGYSVVVSGDTAVVGARQDDDRGFDSGSAYVFEKVDGVWMEVAKLLASDGAWNDVFGWSVSTNGGTIVVGAHRDDNPRIDAGSVYVFEKVDGVWTEVVKIVASDSAIDDRFGISVSISGDTFVVGAHRDDDRANRAGSAYIFEKIDGTWTEVAKLHAADGAEIDRFGWSVAVSGDTAVVGADLDDDRGIDSGSAYVFEKVDGVWTEVAKLLAAEGAEDDFFGYSVSVSGDTAFVGAHLDDDRGTNSGSASIFELDCIISDCLDLEVANLVAGKTALFTLSAGTPGAKAVTVYGTTPGRVAVESYAGYCATFGIDGVTQNKVIGGFNRRFDSNGEITFKLDVPRNLSGRRLFFQSAEHSTCPDECVSNLVELVVR